MGSQAVVDAGVDRFFDDTQLYETVASYSALQFVEDFIGAGHSAGIPAFGSPVAGYPWVKKIVGAAPPTLALVSNAPGGQVSAALTSASEKQEATLYWNDGLSLDGTKKLNFEARIALAAQPSAPGVQAVFGLAQAWIDGPDNNARFLEFGCSGNGNLSLRVKDAAGLVTMAAAPLSSPSSQILLDTNFHIFRIDMTDPTNVGFYFDGARVNANFSLSFASTGSSAIFQPYVSVYKPSGTGIATLNIDKIDVWGQRS